MLPTSYLTPKSANFQFIISRMLLNNFKVISNQPKYPKNVIQSSLNFYHNQDYYSVHRIDGTVWYQGKLVRIQNK